MSDVTRDVELIRSYLLGRLSEDEELLFQDRLARDPSLVRELEQSLRMREGLKQLQEQGYLARSAPRRVDSQRSGILHWLLPAAAVAVIAVVCINIWWERPSVLSVSPTERSSAGIALPIAAHFRFVSMRGAALPEPHLPPSGLIEFAASPETHTGAAYRVKLSRSEGTELQSLGTLSGVAASTDGYVRAYANSSQLKPGDYVLTLEPEGAASGESQQYPFRLLPPGASPSR
jgi:hypothetical protein